MRIVSLKKFWEAGCSPAFVSLGPTVGCCLGIYIMTLESPRLTPGWIEGKLLGMFKLRGVKG